MSDSPDEQYVTFSLNDEEYALNALNVREILELTQITRVPHLPEFLRGVINLRGAIIPVLDLKRRFGMKAGSDKKRACIIVTGYSAGLKGIIVDAVSDVLHIPEESISYPPSFGSQIRTDFIRGIGRTDGKILLILDAETLLTSEELLVTPSTTQERVLAATATNHEREDMP
jgi:purine-binding chemotaxis protein CheW